MSSIDDQLDELLDSGDGSASDAELITAVRAGDERAFGQLWQRHEAAALRLARQLTTPSNAEDLVSESFARLLRVLRQGGGPDGAFRPYLFSTLRRLNIDNARSYGQRISLTADDADLETEPALSAADVAAGHAENSAAWRAWASLPESSRTLLWHLVVEEETPAQIAPIMGTSANGVSSRAVRARERLRQAFLQQHVAQAADEGCRWTRSRLGEYVRDALSARERAVVQAHLDDCDRCPAVLFEIADVNQTLRVVIAPVVLGGVSLAAYSGAGALSGAGAGASGGGGQHVASIAGRARSTAVRGVLVGALGVLVAGGIAAAAAMAGNHPSSRRAGAAPSPAASSLAPVAVTTPVATASSSESSSPELVVAPSSSVAVVVVTSPPVAQKSTRRPTPPTTAPTSPSPPVSAVPVPAVPTPVATTSPTDPSTPTPSPSPSVAQTTIMGQLHQGVWQHPDGTDGTASVEVPDGWTITGVHPLTSMTCSYTATSAQCTMAGADIVANTAYQYTIDLTGPADDHTSTLIVTYDGAGDTQPDVVTPAPLVNP